jgi:hypothetical protein
MMETDGISGLEGLTYFIDLDWFQGSDRSFIVIAQHCLCPDCKERLASESKTMTAASLVTNIRHCCSKVTGFVSPKLPLLEKVFRVLLSEGNESLSLEELTAQLSFYSDSPVSLSPQTLKHILENDQHYGFRQRH